MPLLRRRSMRRGRRPLRRVRNRMGFTRGRGFGMRSRRASLRLFTGSESKFFDSTTATTLSSIGLISTGLASSLDSTVYTTPAVGSRVVPLLLSNIPGGSQVDQRVGNVVRAQHWRVRMVLGAAQLIGSSINALQIQGTNDNFGQVTESAGNVVSGDEPFSTPQKYIRTTFRVVLLRDTQVSLSAVVPSAPISPSVDDIFSAPGGVSFVLANLNVQTLGRYSILYDRNFTCDSDDPQRSLVVNIPMSAPIRFGGASGTDIRAGHLYMCIFAQSAGLNSSLIGSKFHGPNIVWSSRIKYSDR